MLVEVNGLQDAAAANESTLGSWRKLTRRKPCYFKTENTLHVYWLEG